MITWIGLCAGEIWRYLDNHAGETSLKSLLSLRLKKLAALHGRGIWAYWGLFFGIFNFDFCSILIFHLQGIL